MRLWQWVLGSTPEKQRNTTLKDFQMPLGGGVFNVQIQSGVPSLHQIARFCLLYTLFWNFMTFKSFLLRKKRKSFSWINTYKTYKCTSLWAHYFRIDGSADFSLKIDMYMFNICSSYRPCVQCIIHKIYLFRVCVCHTKSVNTVACTNKYTHICLCVRGSPPCTSFDSTALFTCNYCRCNRKILSHLSCLCEGLHRYSTYPLSL